MARKTYRKIITSESYSEQFDPMNKKLVKEFLRDKNMKSSEGTIKGYKSDLDIFFTWNLLENDNQPFQKIKKLKFSQFFSYCIDELQWSPSRFARMRACLSSFSNFIENFYDEDKDFEGFRNVILKAIESIPKSPVREKSIFTEEQVNDLLNWLSTEKNRPQEACLLALAAFSGARISELLRITVDIIDVTQDDVFEGKFLETTKKIRTKGRTKVGKPLHKYIIKDLFIPYLNAWLPIREQIMKENGQDHNVLFIKRDGTPAKTETIRGWSEKWEKRLGEHFYFHALRHYFVTQLTRLGLDSDFIIEISGWSSADMYKLYNDLTAKETKWKNLHKLDAMTSGTTKSEDTVEKEEVKE